MVTCPDAGLSMLSIRYLLICPNCCSVAELAESDHNTVSISQCDVHNDSYYGIQQYKTFECVVLDLHFFAIYFLAGRWR